VVQAVERLPPDAVKEPYVRGYTDGATDEQRKTRTQQPKENPDDLLQREPNFRLTLLVNIAATPPQHPQLKNNIRSLSAPTSLPRSLNLPTACIV
jgi:hypothetical protein